MQVKFTPNFIRQLKKLEPALKEESFEKIELFQKNIREKSLKVHKLNGKLKDRFSFSVNYKTRIVFKYIYKTEIILTAIGDHKVYQV